MIFRRASFIGLLAPLILASAQGAELASPSKSTSTFGMTPPVKLGLHVLNTKPRHREPIMVRLEIINAGKAPFSVSDDVFLEPSPIPDIANGHSGTRLDIRDSSGNAVKSFPPIVEGSSASQPQGRDTVSFEKSVRAQRMIEEWHRQGYSEPEINEKLLLYSRESAYASPIKKQSIVLIPGKSASTIAYRYRADSDLPPGNGKRTESFSEAPFWSLPPGKYKMRAIYDHTWPARLREKNLTPPDDGFIRVVTPFIDIEVVR